MKVTTENIQASGLYTGRIKFKVLTTLPIQGYNSRVSRIKIENLKQRIGGDIIPLIFGKFVTP